MERELAQLKLSNCDRIMQSNIKNTYAKKKKKIVVQKSKPFCSGVSFQRINRKTLVVL